MRSAAEDSALILDRPANHVLASVRRRETGFWGARNKRWKRQFAFMLVLFAGFMAPSAHAADDPVQKAMKELEKHRYEDAARDLRAALPGLPPSKQPSARLALGMIDIRNAELHRALAGLSAEVNADYLRRLSKQRGSGRSRYCFLYLGLAELENGQADRAEAALARFSAGRDRRAGMIALTAQGRAALMQGKRQRAAGIWGKVSPSDPEVKAALADAFSIAGMKDRDPAGMCNSVLSEAVRKGGGAPSIDEIKSCIGVYARTGAPDKGVDLLEKAELKAYSFRESPGKSKVLSFYDVRLLTNLAELSLAEAVAELEKAAADNQLRGIASYYLGEAYAMAGNEDDAARSLSVFLASPKAPPRYRNRAMVLQGEILYRKKKRSEAIGTWEDLTRAQPSEPDLLADILSACGRLEIDCPRPAKTAVALAEAGEGRRFAALHIGLGRYFQGRRDDSRALAELEAGRDKGNKNKIEFNDPLMLTYLADGYYRTKKYSEALEIFFEMSKQFPQVRQLQEALQGVYSMEHKSAGDVKIN